MKFARMKPAAWAASLAFAASFSGCEFGSSPGGGTGVDGLTGIVVDRGGEPVAGARVRVHPAAAPLGKASEALVARADSAFTDAQGRYRFKALPSGTYNLEASIRWHDTTYALFQGGIVFEKKLDLGVDTLRAAGIARVVVKDSANRAVTGATCAIAGSPWSAITDSLGTCTLTGVAPGAYRVQVSGMGAGGVNVTVISNALSVVFLSSGPIPPPSAPTLLADARDSSDSRKPVVFTWSSPLSDAITHYRLQVSFDSLFAVISYDDSTPYQPDSLGVTRCSLTTANEKQTRYWRVRAYGPGGSSVSDTRVLDEGPWKTFTRRAVVADPANVLNAVTWTGSQFVAVGGGGMVMTSPDGIAWTARPTGRPYDFFGVSARGNLLVAVAGSAFGDSRMGDSAILTSTDGVTWTPRYLTERRSVLRAVTWNTSRWVAVGDSGAIWASADGLNGWMRLPSGTTHDLRAVTWSGGSFYAVGYARGDSSSVLLASADGLSWNAMETGPAGSAWNAVATDNTRLIVTGETGEGWYVRTGVPWAKAPYRTGIRGLALGGLFLGAGSVPFAGSGINEHATLWSSTDGAIWTKLFEDGTQGRFNAVVANDQRVVAVGRVIVSSD